MESVSRIVIFLIIWAPVHGDSQKCKDLIEIERSGKRANKFSDKSIFLFPAFIHSTIGGTYLSLVADNDDIMKIK